MAANLIIAGHEVAVYNRTLGKAEKLVHLGAQAFTQASDVCRGEAVITMLANDDAVESVVFREQGILAHLPKGAVHISSSTISVATGHGA
jgi:3-hydroxyisobutyrate dehydrogenase-like beta-hydroxyacid dehydrogenase